jgi:hypothetical protein
MNTNQLIDLALNWAVARANGNTGTFGIDGWNPSTNWAQGGPIIEREEISLCREFSSGKVEWSAWTPAPIRDDAEAFGYGPTPLIAAMRCYVASKLGDEIEAPPEIAHMHR